jgi:hypothetical protein
LGYKNKEKGRKEQKKRESNFLPNGPLFPPGGPKPLALPWAWVSARWARPVDTRVVFPNDLRGCRSRGPGINRSAADSSLACALISTRISLNRSNNSASFPLAPYIKSWPLPPDCFTRATIVEPWSAERNRKPPRPSSCITVAFSWVSLTSAADGVLPPCLAVSLRDGRKNCRHRRTSASASICAWRSPTQQTLVRMPCINCRDLRCVIHHEGLGALGAARGFSGW